MKFPSESYSIRCGSYHPASKGKLTGYNRTVKTRVKKIVEEDHKKDRKVESSI